jgi:hypothetical protein
MFAGGLLLTLGTVNIAIGITTIGTSHFVGHTVSRGLTSPSAQDWTLMCLGLAELILAGVMLITKHLARFWGAAVLIVNAAVQLSFMRAHVVWTLSMVTLDLLTAWGLIVYGKPSRLSSGRLRSRKRPGGATRDFDRNERPVAEAWPGASRQWLAWRREAQRVNRAWNEWSAADPRDQGEMYRRYTLAVTAEDEAAAELQRAVSQRHARSAPPRSIQASSLRYRG